MGTPVLLLWLGWAVRAPGSSVCGLRSLPQPSEPSRRRSTESRQARAPAFGKPRQKPLLKPLPQQSLLCLLLLTELSCGPSSLWKAVPGQHTPTRPPPSSHPLGSGQAWPSGCPDCEGWGQGSQTSWKRPQRSLSGSCPGMVGTRATGPPAAESQWALTAAAATLCRLLTNRWQRPGEQHRPRTETLCARAAATLRL